MPFDYTASDPKVLRLAIGDRDPVVATYKGAQLIVPSAPVAQRVDMKPLGLWYSCGREWIRWTEQERFRPEFVSLHRLRLDYRRLRVIDSVAALDAFNAQYHTTRGGDLEYIDWRAVALAYAGIEICPCQWERRMEWTWYYGWDVASGCVWDGRAVLGSERLL